MYLTQKQMLTNIKLLSFGRTGSITNINRNLLSYIPDFAKDNREVGKMKILINYKNAPILFKESAKSYQQVVASYRSENPEKIIFIKDGKELLKAGLNKGNNNTLMLERFMCMFAINPNTPKNQKIFKELLNYGKIAA